MHIHNRWPLREGNAQTHTVNEWDMRTLHWRTRKIFKSHVCYFKLLYA